MDYYASRERKIDIAAGFIDNRASDFHSAFGPGSTLNRETMEYEPDPDAKHIADLKETLECHQQVARKYVDFIDDLLKCTWEDVHRELHKAKQAHVLSERRGNRNPIRGFWRALGTSGSILAPGLSAIPDELCVLHGGLAVVFSLARHSELNRYKILSAFERLPNIIEEAENKSNAFPLDTSNPKTVRLDRAVWGLRMLLVQSLPALINILIPNSFFNTIRSPFRGCKIDRVLEEVSVCAEAVRVAAEALMVDIHVENHSMTKEIHSQLAEMIQHQRVLQMSIEATQSKTHLLNFLMEQLEINPVTGAIAGRDQGDNMTDHGTAPVGYAPSDVLQLINVNHLRVSSDAARVVRAQTTLPQADIERCALVMAAPQVKQLLNSSCGSGTVAIDGHFDRSQIGKISPLSYVCAVLAQAVRSQAQQPSTPTLPLAEKRPQSNNIVLEFYCALHAGTVENDDDLAGPQGLMRCLSTQLMLALVANEVVGHNYPLPLPHLRDGEEDRLADRDLTAVCRLFVELAKLVPADIPIYCLIDSWSSYEREEFWQADYDIVLDTFREVAATVTTSFKLLLTSSTSSRRLKDFILPSQRVSLRNREASGRDWCGTGRGGLRGLARAATMSQVGGGFGGGCYFDEYDERKEDEPGHFRRTSQ
jgi:hypothetical protein